MTLGKSWAARSSAFVLPRKDFTWNLKACPGSIYLFPEAILLLAGSFRNRYMKIGPATAPRPQVANPTPHSPDIPGRGFHPLQTSSAQPKTVGEIIPSEYPIRD